MFDLGKINYGPRLINISKLIFQKKVEYIRLKRISSVKKNDIIVFNYPQYEYLIDSIAFIYGTHFIKRCFGTPGDIVNIRRNEYEKVDLNNRYDNLFPYDTSLHWSSDYYGPLYVPRKGDTIPLTPRNVKHYHDVLIYENIGIQIRNDSVFFNGIYTPRHYFKYNYYFML